MNSVLYDALLSFSNSSISTTQKDPLRAHRKYYYNMIYGNANNLINFYDFLINAIPKLEHLEEKDRKHVSNIINAFASLTVTMEEVYNDAEN